MKISSNKTIEQLKSLVYEANIKLLQSQLVILTWGNVSAVNRELGIVVIKPSGVDYQKMKPEDMVIVDLKTGKTINSKYKPSSDTPTHLELYHHFPKIGGIVHTHSIFATAFAQAGIDIEPYGTTHADTFYGSVPCVKKLSKKEVETNYEANTGKAIIKCFKKKNIDYNAVPAAILENHGPFTWGKDADEAVKNAITLEAVAKLAYISKTINSKVANLEKYILDKHYYRKHGKNAYYGQK